jgi:uncharacterized protein with PIN domain
MNGTGRRSAVKERPFNPVRRDDLEPVCPHCNKQITEVYYKAKGPGWFLFPRTAIYFCPHCRKVLGLGQSKMA